jgi:hypothetical protein
LCGEKCEAEKGGQTSSSGPKRLEPAGTHRYLVSRTEEMGPQAAHDMETLSCACSRQVRLLHVRGMRLAGAERRLRYGCWRSAGLHHIASRCIGMAQPWRWHVENLTTWWTERQGYAACLGEKIGIEAPHSDGAGFKPALWVIWKDAILSAGSADLASCSLPPAGNSGDRLSRGHCMSPCWPMSHGGGGAGRHIGFVSPLHRDTGLANVGWV